MYIDSLNTEIDNSAIVNNLNRITDRVFKLLPMREEGKEWQVSLQNLTLEIIGLKELLSDQTILFNVLIKMKVLETLTSEEDFLNFRKTIFECLSLLNEIKKCLE